MWGWFLGVLNCFLLFIQLWKIWKVGNSEAISSTMFAGFVLVNVGVSFSGFRDGNLGFGFGMAVSAAICIMIMISTVILRPRGKR